MDFTLIKSLLLILPLRFMAISPIEPESMLFQADAIAKAYAPLIAKAEPPSPIPQTDALLTYACNWFSIDLSKIKTDGRSVLSYLSQQPLWDSLAEIGIQAVELKGLKNEKAQITFHIDPLYGTEEEYIALVNSAMKKGIHLIGKTMGNVTGKGVDFALALKNIGPYSGLYAMIEIDPKDWDALPEVKARSLATNIPWFTVQKLHKMGYVPTQFDPYVKQSSWNATSPILGSDQKMRRWIYLRDTLGFPQLDFLNPSFGALRLAAADSLYSLLALWQPIIQLEELPPNTQETLILMIRKLGGFTSSLTHGGVESLKGCTDVTYDHLTPMAALHALISQDVSALRLIYNLLLEQKIQPKRLIHALEPFGRLPNDWAEFIHSPQKKHRYKKEQVSAYDLRSRLLQEDVMRIKGQTSTTPTWNEVPSIYPEVRPCTPEKKSDIVLSLHLTLAKFFALQPGVFSMSPQDLLGALRADDPVDLLGANVDCLYSCAPNQLSNPRSFASQLKKILRVRRDLSLEKAELVEMIECENKGVLILRYQLIQDRRCALLAVNFSEQPSQEILESAEYVQKTAIDPMTGLAESKVQGSSFFELKVNPYSAKLVVFQPKYTPNPPSTTFNPKNAAPKCQD